MNTGTELWLSAVSLHPIQIALHWYRWHGLWAETIKFRQQYDAFLLVRIGASNDRNAAFRIAEIVGQMGHISGDVDKVAAFSGEVFFESLAVPHPGFAAQDINAGFVAIMPVRLGPSTGWDSHYLQVDCVRTHRLRRDPGCIHERLLSNEFRTGADNSASHLGWVRKEEVTKTCCFHGYVIKKSSEARFIINENLSVE